MGCASPFPSLVSLVNPMWKGGNCRVMGFVVYLQGSCRSCRVFFGRVNGNLLEASLKDDPGLEGWQGAPGAGWEWAHLMPEVEVIQQTLGLTERGNQSLVRAAAAQCSLSPVNPRKLYVPWQRPSMVLLHLLG